MIADRPRPFIFIHIPKNAGTSIEKALLPFATGVENFNSLSPGQRKRHMLPGGVHFPQHAKLKDIEILVDVIDYFKFAIVRNPFERALSQIAYLRRFPVGRGMFPGVSWKDDLMTLAQSKQTIAGQDLGATQLEYLVGKDGSIAVDFVGRVEDLASTWSTIKTALDLPDSLNLQWIFKTRKPLPAECFDEESREAIGTKYRKDFQMFDYDLMIES